MPAPVIARGEAIDRILAVFRRYGYEGASLARLSEATGLGRSSLYHHFPNGKVDMARAAVTSVRAWLIKHVFPALAEDAPPAERLRKFADGLARFSVRKALLVEQGLPLRWGPEEMSPALDGTGSWTDGN